jgi:tRNA threonylcarbamoyladenosine biosynthesis protein TsaE
MEYRTKTARETAQIGQKLATSLNTRKGIEEATVLCLYGDLGSGKTTFTQGFARGLGFANRLLSPTFIIVRRYDLSSGSRFLYHVDLYRTKSLYDIENIGFAEMVKDPGAFVIIEWAERLGDLKPAGCIDIHFALNSDGSHSIHLEGTING